MSCPRSLSPVLQGACPRSVLGGGHAVVSTTSDERFPDSHFRGNDAADLLSGETYPQTNYPDGGLAFFAMLARWREQGDFEGLVVK